MNWLPIAQWACGLAFVASLLGGTWLHGYTQGKAVVYLEWGVEQASLEAEAREAEREATLISNRSAERIAAKEKALDEQAKRQDARWRALLARVPSCRVPRAVGVQLDTASGASRTAAVAEPPGAAPDAAALDQLVRLADELDTVRENYRRARINADRLTEAARWYAELRERFNRREP